MLTNTHISVRSSHELSAVESLEGQTVVIIDVFAHTSLLPEILAAGPARLVVCRVDDARTAYDDLGTGTWVIGDVDQLPEFAHIQTKSSNSPYRFQTDNTAAILANRSVVCATNNGTRVESVALEKHADTVLTASFRNISAVQRHLAHMYTSNPDTKLLIVASGEIQLGVLPPDRDEDRVFAEYFRRVLLGQTGEEDGITACKRIRDIWYTEYAALNAKHGIPKEQIDGDYLFVTTQDTTIAVPQCVRIDGKRYLGVRNATENYRTVN